MRGRNLAVLLVCAIAAALAACSSGRRPEPLPTPAAPVVERFSSDRIVVTAQGEGRDIIFIPGLTSHPDIWAGTVAALGPGYRVHLVHLYGFAGLPAAGNADGPVAAPAAEEIARYIAETGLDKPAVIGHSMGGAIAMMLAARHPEAVGRLMVVDMTPFMGAMFGGANATPESVRPIADQIRAQMRMAPQGAITPILQQTINNMVRTESARPAILAHARTSIVGVSANAFHELIVTDLRPELVHITQPMTVLYVIPPEAPIPAPVYEQYMRLSYANAPQARLIKIDDSYHFIMIDQPGRFAQEVRAFLAE